jgi:hypothetical protein
VRLQVSQRSPATNWYGKLGSQDTPKPGGPIKFRPVPVATGDPVNDWDWSVASKARWSVATSLSLFIGNNRARKPLIAPNRFTT